MSREAQSLLKRFLQEKRLKLIQNIVQDRIHIEVYDGMPRGKAAIHAVAGHIMGEALKQDNKVKVYYGLLREPDLQNVQMDEDDEDGSTATIATSSTTGGGSGGGSAGTGAAGGTASTDNPSTPGGSQSGSGSASSKTAGNAADTSNGKADQPSGATTGQSSSGSAATPAGGEKSSSSSKKKKSKKEWLLSKKGKNDPNAPPLTRMPLPELRDVDKIEKAKALRESAKRVTLGPEKLPSCCFYTVLNGDNQ